MKKAIPLTLALALCASLLAASLGGGLTPSPAPGPLPTLDVTGAPGFVNGFPGGSNEEGTE